MRWNEVTTMQHVFSILLLPFALLLLDFAGFAAEAAPATKAEPPRSFVETRYIPSSGRTIAVREGDDFQNALDRARPGDTITLESGATFVGPFTLPDKPGSDWIVIRGDTSEDGLPPTGTRVEPSDADIMPKLVAPHGSVISTAPGAHHYRFIGIEFRPARDRAPSVVQALRSVWRKLRNDDSTSSDKGIFLHNLISLGSDESSIEELPHHIVLDRCYLHGDPDAGTRRGIVMNSRHTAVIDSYLSDFKEVGADSQAIAGWNGPGPFKIMNNYLEGAGENVMFGGADPSIKDLVPSDIEIRHNHFSKPLSWRVDHPDYTGTPWTVKNLFELKNARRVLIDGNLFEHNWPHAQNGFAILFTVRNQQGSAPWSVVEDIRFTNNVIRKVGSGINILGYDDGRSSQQTKRVLIENNLFTDIGGTWGRGTLFQVLNGTADVAIRHNTAVQTERMVSVGGGKSHEGFAFIGNIAAHNRYGIIGSDAGVGLPTIERYLPGATIRGNAIVGGDSDRYPAANVFPDTFESIGFVERSKGNYRLKSSSRYVSNVEYEQAPGVDFQSLCAALADHLIQMVEPCSPTQALSKAHYEDY